LPWSPGSAHTKTMERSQNTIAVVVPCYKVAAHLDKVLLTIPPCVGRILVVDDGCPEASGRIAEELAAQDPRISVIWHKANKGVGGAVVSGYVQALAEGCDIVVKMDGDGQMDPAEMGRLLQPILDDEADYAKGNRFRDFEAIKQMPRVRLFGNSMLSFLVKAASGYWHIMDPTNGYTAIHKDALHKLQLERIAEDYFFECDMLIRLNLIDAPVADVPMQAVYGEEQSSMRIGSILARFPFRILRGMVKRIFFKYFVYDFNMASVYILLGLPMFIFGALFGLTEWLDSVLRGTPKTAGTIMLAALPVILAFQMLLQAIQIDIARTPQRSRHDRRRL